MRTSAIPFLIRITVRGRRLRNAAVIGGLAVGMLALGLSIVAGLGTTRSLQRHLEAVFPEQRVILKPVTVEAFLMQADAVTITPDTVEAVRRLPGVVRVGPEATVRFPLSSLGEFMGQRYSTDIALLGIEGWLLGDEAPEDFTYDPQLDDSVPAVLSYYFLDLYNVTLAESGNLPKFSPSAILGQRLDLTLGQSTLQMSQNLSLRTKVVPAYVKGLTRNPDLLGLLVPLEAVESFNEWYGIQDKRYRALHVEIESAEAVENLRPHLEPLGLELYDPMAPWRKALIVVGLVAVAFVALGMLVFALALAYVASTITWMLSERRRELALFRALGAAPRQVMTLLATEVGAISALGIGLGLTVAIAALDIANRTYLNWRGERAFLPDTLFTVPWWWILLLGLACWGLAMGLSLTQVIATTRIPISTALAKNE